MRSYKYINKFVNSNGKTVYIYDDKSKKSDELKQKRIKYIETGIYYINKIKLSDAYLDELAQEHGKDWVEKWAEYLKD